MATVLAFSEIKIGNFVSRGVQHIRCNSTAAPERAAASIKPFEQVPGPRSFPIIKTAYKFIPPGSWSGGFGKDLLRTMYKEYGPMVRLHGLLGNNSTLFLLKPEYIEKVYRSEEHHPNRQSSITLETFRKTMHKDYYENALGLLITQGKEWYDFRSKVNAPMLQPKIIKLYTSILDQVSKDMIKRLQGLRDKDNRLTNDFGHEINLWALEAVASVALGTRIGCFDENLPKDSLPNKLIRSAKTIMQLSFDVEFKPGPFKFLRNSGYKKLIDAYQTQMDVAQHYINQAMERIRSKSQDELDNDDLDILTKLLAIDKKVAVVMATDMMLAGVDTTSNTIIACLYYLSKNQEKQDKLRSILKEASKNNVDTDRIPYLNACLKEAMRLFPVVIGNVRKLSNDIVLGGYHIPKMTDVILVNQYCTADPEQFINPEDFVPERFLKEDHEMKSACTHPFANLPFGFGSRQCIGRRIAELEMRLFLARLITSFRVEWKGPPIVSKSTNLNFFVPPYYFILHDV